MSREQPSKNERAERVVGLRPNLNAIAIDHPTDFDYHCPHCTQSHTLEWSEYNGFVWCRSCDKDYPTCFCIPDMDSAIDCYLATVSDAVKNTTVDKQAKSA